MISIIIPIYNVEPYVEKCLQSVAEQTYKGDMECLLIDDKGTDRSMDIVQQFVASYHGPINFRILQHDHNRGLSAARNTGIDNAKGDWIYFLDSDDWIIPECLALMYECIERYPNTDLVHAGAKATWKQEYMSLENRTDLPEHINNKEWISQKLFRIWVTAWNNLIKRDFIISHHLRFVEGIKHEDEIWTFDLSLSCPVTSFCFIDTYIYVWRENSIMTSRNNVDERFQAYCKIWNIEIEHLEAANDYRPWFIKKIWHHIFYFYDKECNFVTQWKIRCILWRLASHCNWKMAIAIIMSSSLTKTHIDNYLYRRFIYGQLLWETPSCNPLI